MKAVAVFPSQRELKLVDISSPTVVSPTQARIRILDVGICGTDREICAFDYGTPPAGAQELVIGHEALGEVTEVGPRVTRVKLGDLVVPMVRRPCDVPSCTACRVDRQDFCFTGEFRERGIREQNGFMTEEIVEEERYLNVLPREFRDVGVLVEPLTIAEKALIQIWQMQERLPWQCPHKPGKDHGHCRRAVVLGAGPVGLLGAMALRANEFETFVYSREVAPNPKAELVGSIGATYVSAEQESPSDLAKRVGPIDLVYEAAGASAVAFAMMQSLGPNSAFVFTGVPGRKGPIEVDTDRLMRSLVLNNQLIFGTVNAGRDAFEAAIRDVERFAKSWPQQLRALITGRFPIDRYRDLLLERPTGIKNVITFAA